MEIGVPSIDTSGFKPHQLANAGLVICTLTDGEEEVVAVNMVTQVPHAPCHHPQLQPHDAIE